MFAETLRKYPPSIVLKRCAQIDYEIPDTDLVIEKGVTVLIPVFAIHHDSNYYPDPEKFDPNRFTAEETKKRHPMTWLPFGEGPRNCIAARFAMMQIRVGIISLLRNFKFSPCNDTPIPMDFGTAPNVLSPKNRIRLNVEPIISVNEFNV